MNHTQLIEKEINEGFGDDSLIPPTPDKCPPGQSLARLSAPSLDESPVVDREEPLIEPIRFEPQFFAADPEPEAKPGGWWAWFPMGGWVYHGVATRMQRVDQGQDFEVPNGHHIIAPSWGKCIRHLSDREWPSGFGSPYAVVYIAGPCRFKGRFWYLGHDNGSPIVPVGHWFHSMEVLATPNHHMSYGWSWTELGHAPNGYPGSFGEGARWHWAFAPAKKWATY